MPIYLKYGDLKGDVTEPAHRSWIEVETVSYEMGAPLDIHHDLVHSRGNQLTTYKEPDRASIAFYQHLANDVETAHAIVDIVRDDGGTRLRLVMSGVKVVEFKRSAMRYDSAQIAKMDKERERLTLHFKSIEVKREPGAPPG